MKKKRAFAHCTAESGNAQFVQKGNLEALILMCPELHNERPPAWPGTISGSILQTEGGVSGASTEPEPHNHWLVHYLRSRPQINLVILCGHYGCSLISPEGIVSYRPTPVKGMAVDRLGAVEQKFCQEIESLRAVLAASESSRQIQVLGCLYDPEYQWLSIYDDETKMFLPAHVHSFNLTRKNHEAFITVSGACSEKVDSG